MGVEDSRNLKSGKRNRQGSARLEREARTRSGSFKPKKDANIGKRTQHSDGGHVSGIHPKRGTAHKQCKRALGHQHRRLATPVVTVVR